MALKFALILQAVDRLSAPAKKAAAGAKALARGARDLEKSGAPAARAMERVSRVAGRMPARLRLAGMRIKQLAGRAGMKGLELAARGAGTVVGTLIGKTLRLAAGLAKLALAGGAFAAGATFGNILSVGRQFEDLEVRLSGVTGSLASARKELRDLVAMKLPAPIAELGEAYVQARKAGIDPTRDSLKALIGESINSKKTIDELISTLAEAKNGDFGGLEPLKIKASMRAGRAYFQYLDRDGKRAVVSARDNGKAIEKALMGIFGARSSDAVDAYARSLTGIGVQLKNWWNSFSLKIADAGIYDKIKAKLQAFLDWLDKKLADGSINKWATSVSEQLGKVVEWVDSLTQKDWDNFIADLKNVAKGFRDLVSLVGQLIGLLNKLDQMYAAVESVPDFLDRPDKWIDRHIWGIGGDRKKPPQRAAKPAPAATRAARDGMWRRAMRPSQSRAAPLGLRQRSAAPAAPQKVAVGGEVTVKIDTAPGLRATPGRLAQTGDVGLRAVYGGRAMTRAI